MEFYELALAQLPSEDQAALRQRLLIEAVKAYLRAKPGIGERYGFNHHHTEYNMGSGGNSLAELYAHRQPPLLKLLTGYHQDPLPEGMPERMYRPSHPVWGEFPLDGHLSAEELQTKMDYAYQLFMQHQTDLLPLMDRTLPDESKLRRLCEVYAFEDAESVVSWLQPAIRIQTRRYEEYHASGLFDNSSHFGGDPSLPLDTAWPRYKDIPMAFLAQINLAEIPPLAGREQLPAQGILYFFSALGWGDDHYDKVDFEDRATTRVIFYDGDQDAEHLRIQLPPKGMPYYLVGTRMDNQYPHATLKFKAELTLPDDNHIPTIPDWTEAEWETYREIAGEFTFLTDDHFRFASNHQMLGWGYYLQGYVKDEDEVLLLQLDCDYQELDFHWGDGGLLYFHLPLADLKKHDFSHCHCSVESG